MSKKLIWSGIVAAVFVLAVLGIGLATQFNHDQSSHVTTQQKRPLIMIAGSDSTRTDFNDIIAGLDTQHPHPVINVTVTDQQQIEFQHTRVNNTDLNDTLIVIYFENSTDSNANIVTQTNGLAKALTQLKRRYRLTTANALGYSNGGLIWSRYLAGLAPSKALPIHDLMLLGTPFLGTDQAHPDRELFTPLRQHRQAFKALHAVVNVAGDTSAGDDQVVPLSSVTAGGQLFMNQAKRYTQMTVNTADIRHGNLLHERYILRLIRQNLLNQ
ncbi:alpha/beta hydrolase [Lactiplantibacillus modestisalitolerans]|uniref:Alpha/beta hydrolase n=1 Tax=Lactiplantibacillus modestisalitolerans TaxID=1457219 RepID=A0ABV5WXI7_9LACO|nr:alpha/beta hydrolase [Lactiplantibacillus modestisalitolerans]